MQAILVVTAVLGFLGTIVLAGVRERFRGSEGVAGFQLLCVLLWLVSVVLLAVFFPGSSTPDPRF